MKRLKIITLSLLFLLSCSSFAEELQGSLVWGQRVILGFPVTGVIKQLDVQSGSRVKQGQLLARLDKTPFESQLKKARSAIDKIEPMLFDAQQDYDQSLELYDRTVLSEVELQKAEVRLKGVKAEQDGAKAGLELALWHHRQSQLIAPFDGIVVYNNLAQGMIVSEENQSELRIELVPAGVMQVQLKVSAQALASINIDQQTNVIIGNDSYKGTVKRIEPLPGIDGRFTAVVEFSHPVSRSYIAQQAATVNF